VFKVDMIKKGAEVFFSNGSSMSGSFFVSQRSSTHLGDELVSDLFSTENLYIPFELEDEEIVLLQKKCIAMAILEENELSKDPSRRKEIETQVCFISGETINGKVYTDLPKSHTRLSDFLNYSKDFFCLDVGDRDYLVNSRFVRMIRPGPSA